MSSFWVGLNIRAQGCCDRDDKHHACLGNKKAAKPSAWTAVSWLVDRPRSPIITSRATTCISACLSRVWEWPSCLGSNLRGTKRTVEYGILDFIFLMGGQSTRRSCGISYLGKPKARRIHA